jgi:hypothetical protein
MTDPSLHPALAEINGRLRSIEEKVTRTDQDMGQLLGSPGREGKIPQMERDISELQQYKNQAVAAVKTTATWWGGLTFVAGLVGHWLMDTFRGHH